MSEVSQQQSAPQADGDGGESATMVTTEDAVLYFDPITEAKRAAPGAPSNYVGRIAADVDVVALREASAEVARMRAAGETANIDPAIAWAHQVNDLEAKHAERAAALMGQLAADRNLSDEGRVEKLTSDELIPTVKRARLIAKEAAGWRPRPPSRSARSPTSRDSPLCRTVSYS